MFYYTTCFTVDQSGFLYILSAHCSKNNQIISIIPSLSRMKRMQRHMSGTYNRACHGWSECNGLCLAHTTELVTDEATATAYVWHIQPSLSRMKRMQRPMSGTYNRACHGLSKCNGICLAHKTELVTDGANATAYVWHIKLSLSRMERMQRHMSGTETRHKPLHILHP